MQREVLVADLDTLCTVHVTCAPVSVFCLTFILPTAQKRQQKVPLASYHTRSDSRWRVLRVSFGSSIYYCLIPCAKCALVTPPLIATVHEQNTSFRKTKSKVVPKKIRPGRVRTCVYTRGTTCVTFLVYIYMYMRGPRVRHLCDCSVAPWQYCMYMYNVYYIHVEVKAYSLLKCTVFVQCTYQSTFPNSSRS